MSARASEVNVNRRPGISRKTVSSASDLPPYVSVLTKPGEALATAGDDWRNSRCAILLDSAKNKSCVVVCTDDFFTSPKGYMNLRSKLDFRGWTIKSSLSAKMDLVQALNTDDKSLVKVPTGGGSSEKERRFDEIAKQAFRMDASDIHIEVRRSDAAIYFRVYKQMQLITEMTREEAVQLCRAVYESLSETDSRSDGFNEKRRLKAVIERNIDGILLRFRFQQAPVAPSGFDCVMRILPIGLVEERPKTFTELGYSEHHSKEIEVMFAKPEGVTIVAGTTGSGKSTTLKHAIGQIIQRKPQIKVRTVEDPVEYLIHKASQTPVVTTDKNEKEDGRNTDFERTISAIMRMDPDAIMIGEVRDTASADLLVKAVQSGHQVVTTLHAASAIDIIPRLVNLGVARDVVGSPNFIAGLIYQKLVPMLCSECKQPWAWGTTFDLHPGLSERMEYVARPGDPIFKQGPGCKACSGIGISGISVCAESVLPDEEILEMFMRGQDISAYQHWRKQFEGTIDSLSEDGLAGAKSVDHAILKMRKGLVSPVDVEDTFGFFTAKMYKKKETN